MEGRLRPWSWVLAGATMATLPAIAWLALRTGAPPTMDEDVDLFEFVPITIVTAAGLVVTQARPGNTLGWLLLGIGAATAVTLFSEAYGLSAWPPAGHRPDRRSGWPRGPGSRRWSCRPACW